MSRAERLAQRLTARNAEGNPPEEEKEDTDPKPEGGPEAESEGGTGPEGEDASPEKADAPAVNLPDPGVKEQGKDARAKFQAYVLRSVQDEAKAIVYWTNNRPGGYASLTELAEAALIREIHRMRSEFTNGTPFPATPVGYRLPNRPPGKA